MRAHQLGASNRRHDAARSQRRAANVPMLKLAIRGNTAGATGSSGFVQIGRVFIGTERGKRIVGIHGSFLDRFGVHGVSPTT